MNVTPGLPDDKVNVTHVSALSEFFALLLGLLAIIVGIYFTLGWAAGELAKRMPTSWEQKIQSGILKSSISKKELKAPAPLLLDLFQNLSKHSELRITPQLKTSCMPIINAVALPGSVIVIFEGLMKEMQSENELAFILGHELGHVVHRDHLKMLGRSLILMTTLSLIGFEDTAMNLGNIAGGAGLLATARFTQAQESAADQYGAELLAKTYGHTGGGVDFFRRLSKETVEGPWQSWIASHPPSEDRVKALENLAKEKNWPVLPTLPIHRKEIQSACEAAAKE